MSSYPTYHEATPTEEERRRHIRCWTHTKQRQPEVFARTIAKLPAAQRKRLMAEIASTETHAE